ncbi:4Fe-4S dicluster domain-containing protein [Thermocladium modestius]|uniref:4Fe-4S dicluster domain-containing protein n=1 Tax=Thermocladium modestius TaxID=62609 RepID=UPI00166B8B79|nr:ferredoxin family protein [Thermocladium modestius]
MLASIKVIDEKCIGCGICWSVCPKAVLAGELRGVARVINGNACHACFSCQNNCPTNAIYVSPTSSRFP